MLAVLIADMCGFSFLTERDGIEAAAEAVELFWKLGAEVVDEHGGRFVKRWPDDFMATFPTVRQAEVAGRDITYLVPCSVGVGWGEVLERSGELWGAEINLASKLGEDVGREGDVLLTEAAKVQLQQEAAPEVLEHPRSPAPTGGDLSRPAEPSGQGWSR